ncbi:hypothetical protein [Noviherbaspirillum malthae]|uniref:hypothetical protein n=1 Tax=Noviherbaspirillum malthae TaxID=1260987 RepID=UPI00188DD7FB|nr:hypothetical protein [Noviherbaspirillum malthae]
MRTRITALPLVAVVLALTLAGCNKDSQTAADNGIRQTKFPGQLSAGGGTSGEVMAQASNSSKAGAPSGTPGIPQGAGGNTGGAAMGNVGATGANAGQEGVRGQAPGGTGVAGTPGIPEGSGGTPSGAEMGGTTSGAAATQNAPAPGGAPPAVPGQGSAK